MKAEIRDGKLILTMDIEKEPRPSASGKTIVIASTHGNQSTTAQWDGKTVVVGCNAYVKR